MPVSPYSSLVGGGYYAPFGIIPGYRPRPTVTAPTPPATPVVAQINPEELANATYGKRMPLSVLGKARIGGAIVFGPYIEGDRASFGISFGVPANVTGSRVLFDIALDSKIAWRSTAGATTSAGGSFVSESFTFRFYQGTLTQSVDALEALKFGAQAIAYRPQMMIFFENLPIAAFGDRIPYVSALIGDVTGGADPDDGVNVGDALEQVAYSPWAGYTSDTFVSENVTDVVDALLLADNFSIIELCQNVTRAYPNLDLVQSDKIKIVDHGATVDYDLIVELDNIIDSESPVQFVRGEASAVARELELQTVDPDLDYTLATSLSRRPRDPAVVSVSVGKETITLPFVMGASTRQSLVTYSQYYQENARKRGTVTIAAYGMEIEPGDRIVLNEVADGLLPEVYKVTETLHGANFTVEVGFEAILRCTVPAITSLTDPYWTFVFLLLPLSSNFTDESGTGATLTASGNASIVGGALVCDGTGDGIVSGGSDFALVAISPTNTSPYTMECYVSFVSVNRQQTIFGSNAGLGGQHFQLWQDGNDELQFLWDDTGTAFSGSLSTSGANLSTGSEYHVAVDKDSTGKIRIYVGGVMYASDTPADSTIMVGIVDPISVGCTALNSFSLEGSVRGVRMTAGASRYGDVYGDTSFGPPLLPFPTE